MFTVLYNNLPNKLKM